MTLSCTDTVNLKVSKHLIKLEFAAVIDILDMHALAKVEEEKREQELKKLKEEIKGIAYDIKKVDRAVEEEDSFINRTDILTLDKALARRY